MPAIAGQPDFPGENLNYDPKKAFSNKTRCHAASNPAPKQFAKSLANHAILLASSPPVPRIDGFVLCGVAGGSRIASGCALAAQVCLRSSHRPAARPNKAIAKISDALSAGHAADLRCPDGSSFYLSAGAGVLLGNDWFC